MKSIQAVKIHNSEYFNLFICRNCLKNSPLSKKAVPSHRNGFLFVEHLINAPSVKTSKALQTHRCARLLKINPRRRHYQTLFQFLQCLANLLLDFRAKSQ